MNPVKEAIYQGGLVEVKDHYVHQGVPYLIEDRKARRYEKIITTSSFGQYKKGQVFEVSDYTKKEVWVKNEEGFPIPVRHSEYSVLVPMDEAQPLPIKVFSPAMLNKLEASGTPIFNQYNHTVLDFSNVDGGHTLVLKLPAGDHITVCGMVMSNRKDFIVDIEYHGDNGQQMIGFTGNESPRVQDDRIKHKLYSLDIRPDHKDKPYGSSKDTSFRRLDEVIIDISINVGHWIAENSDSMPDGYDSRVLVREIHNWAVEFEKEFGNEPRDDYYERVDAFSVAKISNWSSKYTE